MSESLGLGKKAQMDSWNPFQQLQDTIDDLITRRDWLQEQLDALTVHHQELLLYNEQRRKECETLRAENARQRAWIDGVMNSVTLAWSDRAGTHACFNGEKSQLANKQCVLPLITRPATFEDK